MSFADVQKTHANYIVSHVMGETIGYRLHPALSFTSMSARVRRNPVDISGEVLSNSIEVLVSKSDVISVTVGKDEIKLTSETVPLGQVAPRYTVHRVLEELPGSFVLICDQ